MFTAVSPPPDHADREVRHDKSTIIPRELWIEELWQMVCETPNAVMLVWLTVECY